MFLSINIPSYEQAGIQVFWEKNSSIQLVSNTDCVNIIGTRPAFYSLAKQMLYFCYNSLPDGAHVHFDDFFCRSAWFGKGLIIELTGSSPHGINSAYTQNGQTITLEIPELLTSPLWHEDSEMHITCYKYEICMQGNQNALLSLSNNLLYLSFSSSAQIGDSILFSSNQVRGWSGISLRFTIAEGPSPM